MRRGGDLAAHFHFRAKPTLPRAAPSPTRAGANRPLARALYPCHTRTTSTVAQVSPKSPPRGGGEGGPSRQWRGVSPPNAMARRADALDSARGVFGVRILREFA